MAVNRKDLKEFSRETAIKNEDKALKAGEYNRNVVTFVFTSEIS